MSSQDTAQAGRDLVFEELVQLGASPAGDSERNHRWLCAQWPGLGAGTVRVSTRRSGTWQTSTKNADPDAPDDTKDLWAFADLSVSPPAVYVAFTGAVRRDIYRHHTAWLAENGYARWEDRKSTHHAIPLARAQALDVGWPGTW